MDRNARLKYQREYRRKHRVHLNALGRAWYKKHARQYQKKHRDYYWSHSLEHNARSRANYCKNPARYHQRTKQYWKRHPLESRLFIVLTAIRQRCNNSLCKAYRYYGRKGVQCSLTLQDMVALWKRDKAHKLRDPSIDRIDNDGDYVLSNARFIERSDNTRKSWRERLRH